MKQTSNSSTFALRLPASLKKAITELAKEDGISVNQFITIAAAEKLSAIRTADFFAERAARADMEAFRKLLNRTGGEPPRPGDEMPQD
jgi:hypothetical protein